MNDSEYSYTVTAADGETPSYAVQGLADAIMATQRVVDPDDVVIGLLFQDALLVPWVQETPAFQSVYMSDLENGVYNVPNGMRFVKADDFPVIAETGILSGEDIFSSEGAFFSSLFTLPGGTIYKPTEALIVDAAELSAIAGTSEGEAPALPIFEFFISEGSGYVALSTVSLREALAEFLAEQGQTDPSAVDTLLRELSFNLPGEAELFAAVVLDAAGTPTLRLTAPLDTGLDVAIGDAATGVKEIVNVGLVTSYEVSFVNVTWPTETNGDNTTKFPRELSVTIDGQTVSAAVHYEDDGTLNEARSVQNLVDAINAAKAATAAVAELRLEVMGTGDGYSSVQYDSVAASGTVTINGTSYDLPTSASTLGELVSALDTLIASVATATIDADAGELVITTLETGLDRTITFDGQIELLDSEGDTVGGNDVTDASARGVGLDAQIADAVVSNTDSTTLVISGSTPPVTDGDAPTFTVEGASVDQNGVQQETNISFSDDPADYYEGGTLSVEIAGQTITANMVAGDPGASVAALKVAIDVAADGANVAEFVFSNDIDANTALNIDPDTASGRYSVNLKIGDVTLVETIVADDASSIDTVGELVAYLNSEFSGVALFSLDAANNKITVLTDSETAIVDVNDVSKPTIQLNLANVSTGDLSVGQVTPQQATLPGVVESVETFSVPNPLWDFSDVLPDGVVLSDDTVLAQVGESTMASFAAALEGGELNQREIVITQSFSAGGLNIANVTTVGQFLNFISDRDTRLNLSLDETGTKVIAKLSSGASLEDFDKNGQVVPQTLEFRVSDGNGGTAYLSGDYDVDATFLPELVITAATEEPDPLQVVAEQSYEGEYQQATITLEDAAQYTAFADGTDLGASGRGADVYFDGGKAYVKITGAGDDGVLGTADDTASVVSADMVPVAYVSTIETQNLTADFVFDGQNSEFQIDVLDADFESFDTYTAEADETIGTFLNRVVASDDRVLSAEFDSETGTIVFNLAAEGQRIQARGADENSQTVFVNFAGSTAVSNTSETAQALVDAINDRITGVAAVTEPDTPAIVTIEGSFTGNEAFASNTVREFSISGLNDGEEFQRSFAIKTKAEDDAVNRIYNSTGGVAGLQNSSVDSLSEILSFLETDLVPEISSAAIDSDTGDIVITSAGSGADTSLSVTFDFAESTDFDTALTDSSEGEDGAVTKSATGGDGVQTPAIPADLADVLESAELGEDGTITLTAREAGKEKFEVTDVTLDYSGVKQIATISLEDAEQYLALTDGTGLGASGRGADVYFEGGKVFADIDVIDADGGVEKTVTVSVDMVTTTRGFVVSTVGLTADHVFDSGNNRFVMSLQDRDGQLVEYLSNDDTVVGGQTIDDVLSGFVAKSANIASATFDPDTGTVTVVLAAGFNEEIFEAAFDSADLVSEPRQTFIDLNASSSTVYPTRFPGGADTAEALAEAIQAAIDGVVAEPATVTIEGDYAAEDKLYENVSSWNQSVFISLDGTVVFDHRVNPNGFSKAPSEFGGFDTVGELIAAIDDVVEGLTAKIDDDGNIVIQSEKTGSAVKLDVVISFTAEVGVTPMDYSSDEVVGADSILGELDGVLGSVSVDGTTITLEAAEAGKEVFEISDVRMDYAGVKQIAEVDFTALAFDGTTAPTYFDGGKLEVKIQETLADGTAVGDVITISANMADGDDDDSDVDAAGTLAALVEAIEGAINPRATSSFGEGLSVDTVLFDSTASAGDQFQFSFFYDEDGDLTTTSDYTKADGYIGVVGVDGNSLSLSFNAGLVTDEFAPEVPTGLSKVTLGTLIDLFNATDANGTALPVELSIADGGLVLSGREGGISLVGLRVDKDPSSNVGTTDGEGFVSGSAPEGAEFLSSVSVENGVITLTSADNVKQQFTVTAATASDPAKVDVTEVSFSTTDSDYFATGSDANSTVGKVSIDVGEDGGENFQTFIVDMVEGDALATAKALLAEMEATEGGLDSTFASVKLDLSFGDFVDHEGLTDPTFADLLDEDLAAELEVDITQSDGGWEASIDVDGEDGFAANLGAYDSFTVSDFEYKVGSKGQSKIFSTDTAYSRLEDWAADAQKYFREDYDPALVISFNPASGLLSFDSEFADSIITPGKIDLQFAERELTDAKFVFTGAEVNEDLNISASASVDAVAQVTKITFPVAIGDDAFIGGIGRDVSVEIDGETFKIDGSTRLELLEDLEAQLKTAISDDTEGEGISAVLAADGISIDEGDGSTGPSMTLTARYGGVDPLEVSTLTRAQVDLSEDNPVNVYQELQVGFTTSYLNSLEGSGKTLTLDLGQVSASYEVKSDDTPTEIVAGLADALSTADPSLLESASVNSDDNRYIDIKAAYPGPNVLGTVSIGQENTVKLTETNGSTVEVTTGFFAEQIVEGVIDLDETDQRLVGNVSDETEGSDLNPADANAVEVNTTQAAKAQTDENVDYTNPGTGEGADATFFGDADQQTTDAPLPSAGDYTFAELDAATNTKIEGRSYGNTLVGNDLTTDGVITHAFDFSVFKGTSFEITDTSDATQVMSAFERSLSLDTITDLDTTVAGADGSFPIQDGASKQFLFLITDSGTGTSYLWSAKVDDLGVFKPSNAALVQTFSGFAPSSAADFTGGVTQTHTNPDNGYTAIDNSPQFDGEDLGEGDSTFFGDAAIDGAEASALPTVGPNGVVQTYTNPDNGYSAIDGSPEFDGEDTETGEGALFGSGPGYYDDEGLWTSYLNGGTLADPAGEDDEGNDLYSQLDGEDLDPLNIGDGSGEDDGGVAGEDAGSADLAGEDIDGVDGFAPFVWDESDLTILSEASTGADVINNFQVSTDPEVTFTWTGENGYSVVGRFTYDEAFGSSFGGSGSYVGLEYGENSGIIDMTVSFYDANGDLLETSVVVSGNGDGMPGDVDSDSFVAFTYSPDTGSFAQLIGFEFAFGDLTLGRRGPDLVQIENPGVVDSGTLTFDIVDSTVQVSDDLIALEGELAESTLDGVVDAVLADPVAVPVSVGSSAVSAGSDLVTGGPTLVFDWDQDYDGGRIEITGGEFLRFYTGIYGTADQGIALNRFNFGAVDASTDLVNLSFDNLEDFVAALNSTQDQGQDAIDIVGTIVDGNLVLSLNEPYDSENTGGSWRVYSEQIDIEIDAIVGTNFDLSTTEFGLVDSASSTLSSVDVSDADEVADLLNTVFDFDTMQMKPRGQGQLPSEDPTVIDLDGGGSGEINTTIFAVTASDDDSVTAIWAHTQSSSDDRTVEAEELNLLTTVNTTGGEFSSSNFAIWDGQSFEQPILQIQEFIPL